MELHGSITSNLRAAVESSRRLKGHPIHRDTLLFWSRLIREARAMRATQEIFEDPDAERYIAELEITLSVNAI